MKPKYHELPELPLEEYMVPDALECVLHSILFQRLLKQVMTSEESLLSSQSLALPITYVRISRNDDEATSIKVSRAVQEFASALAKAKEKTDKLFSVELKFFSNNSQGVEYEWEQWIIPVRIRLRASKTELQNAITDALTYISRSTDSAITDDYIPDSANGSYDFTIRNSVGGATLLDSVSNIFTYFSYR